MKTKFLPGDYIVFRGTFGDYEGTVVSVERITAGPGPGKKPYDELLLIVWSDDCHVDYVHTIHIDLELLSRVGER